MTLPRALQLHRTDALRVAPAWTEPVDAGGPADGGGPALGRLRARAVVGVRALAAGELRLLAGGTLRVLTRAGLRVLARGRLRVLAERAARRGVEAAVERARPRLVAFIDRQVTPVREQIGANAGRLEDLEEVIGSIGTREVQEEQLAREVKTATVNLELLKGEVRNVVDLVEGLGMAIAPATGIDGAQDRMAELRERLNGLDRRVRQLMQAPPPAPSGPAGAPETGAPETGAPEVGAPEQGAAAPAGRPGGERVESALFDYVGFERRFRGDPAEVLQALDERYGALLTASPPVLDVGCGRAELLQMLAERGIPALGVDTDPSMVAEARSRGLEVHQQDAVSYLRQCEPHSLGAVIATHVVEHLALDELIELLELAATRLRPGGVLIAETPNPQSLIVLGNSYLLDPTHVRPLHPSLLAFLCEGAGFRDVQLRFFAPATGYHLPLVEDPDAPPWVETVNEGFRRLNDVLFGPQDFAVVATTAR